MVHIWDEGLSSHVQRENGINYKYKEGGLTHVTFWSLLEIARVRFRADGLTMLTRRELSMPYYFGLDPFNIDADSFYANYNTTFC